MPVWMLLFALLQEPDSEGQTSEQVADVGLTWSQLESKATEDEREFVYFLDDLQLTLADGSVTANKAIVRLERASYLAATTGDPIEPGSLPPSQSSPAVQRLSQRWIGSLLRELGLPAEQEGLLNALDLIGDVRIESSDLKVDCDELRHNGLEGRTYLSRSDVRLPAGQGPRGWPVRFQAARLVEEPDGSLHAFDVAWTTCNDPEPHYTIDVREVHGVPTGDGRWSWSPSGGWLSIGGDHWLPVPTADFNTGEESQGIGLTGLRIHSNSALGVAIEPEFSSRAKWFDDQLAVDWSLYPILSVRRGLPLRGVFSLDADGYEGKWDLFYLYDLGSDVHPYRRRVARKGDSRWRFRLDNRFDLGDGWRLDADFALTSDPLVDPEFFSREWRENDDEHTELYLRKLFEDAAFEGNLIYRIDEVDYTPIEGFGPVGGPPPQNLETLPVARWQGFARTLFTVPAGPLGGQRGEIPVNLSYGAEAGRFRLRDRSLRVPFGTPRFQSRPAMTRHRVRAWTELAAPFSVQGAFFRPGVRAEGAAYDEDVFGRSSAQRGSMEVFFETGMYFEKTWPHGWRHRVLPQIRYRARQAGGDDPTELLQFDDFDAINDGSVVELSLRQFYIAPGTDQSWVDLDFLIPLYPDRDQPLVDRLFPGQRRRNPPTGAGPAEFRMVWTPGVHGETLDGLRLETRYRHHLGSGGFEELIALLSVNPSDDLRYRLGFRKVDDLFSLAVFEADWRFAEAWGVAFKQPYSFAGRGVRASELSLRHYAHDFVFEVGITRDTSVGNAGFFFNLFPRFLVDDGPGTGF